MIGTLLARVLIVGYQLAQADFSGICRSRFD